MEDILSPKCWGNQQWTRKMEKIFRITHVKNRIQLIKKLLSFGLRNEGFRWVGIKMEILNFRLFSLQFFLRKTKDMKYFLTWAQNGKPKDELSLSTSKDATIRSPDIVKITKTIKIKKLESKEQCSFKVYVDIWYSPHLPPNRQILEFIRINYVV